jgi:choline dehydrogenase-like flavoprotein
VADICIVGAGPAGIAIAKQFDGTDVSVLLIESGGLDFDKQTQDLYRGTNTRGDFKLHRTRYRMLGGTSYVWGGWCAPLDPSDFESKSWVPGSGWPIGSADLAPYYRRAQPLFELGRYRYEADEWDFGSGRILSLDPDKLRHRLWQLSPLAHFGDTYADELRRFSNVKVLLYANVVDIETNPEQSTVTGIALRDLHGRQASVKASVYVIACGGIETARLLLASQGRNPNGVGNGNDLVGRYFMEHPHPDAGGVMFSGAPALMAPYYEREFESERVVVGLGPSPVAQERLQILNCSIVLHGAIHHDPSEGMDSLIKLSRAIESRQWPDNAGQHVWRVLSDLDDVLKEAYLRVSENPVTGFGLIARTEVAPNPDNRVTLDSERDELGMQRVQLDWQVGELERTTVAQTVNLMAQEFGRLDAGRVQVNELLLEDDDAWSRNLSWFGHHMGTTRMSTDPRTGVVDPDCKVHGLANLYVASSSVFPTSGYANPTLTIVALAIRLADHLRSLAQHGSLGGQ